MTGSGLRWIDYSSRVHNRVEVAARRAVMTGFRQIQGWINEQTAKELGTDSYEVTWHAGARPAHQPWQGKVWTMKQLQSVCGLGEVTGLHGANCYHDYNPFIPGVSVRTYTDDWLDAQNRKENTPKTYLGKQYTTYEALQRQRRMETVMRKYRRDIELMKTGGAPDYDIVLKQARYQGKLQEYRAFSKSMGLPVLVERVYQDGLGGNNKNTQIILNVSAGNGTMESDFGRFKGKLRSDQNIEKEYYRILKEKFSHGSDVAKRAFTKFATGETIEDHSYEGVAEYSDKSKKIKMHYWADMHNDRGAGATWFHEHGHLIDDLVGNVSSDEKFIELLFTDLRIYKKEYGRKKCGRFE